MSTGAFWPVRNTSSLYPSEILERPVATVVWDYQNCVPLVQIPSWDKPVALITPVVVPPAGNHPADNRDPFEIFGKSISGRAIPIRHVPYTKNKGIDGVHVAFIKRAKIVIFVISHLDGSGNPLQLQFAELVARICESRRLIILACCDIAGQNISNSRFRTLVHVTGYANPDLLVASALILDGDSGLAAPPMNISTGALVQSQLDVAEPAWSVRPWVAERDLLETCALWQACIPPQFHLDATTLGSLLKRDGYALHYVVRDPTQGSLVGFCAAYTTFADSSDIALVGSIAAIMVQAAYRGQGIGSSLHNAAINKLRSVRGVQRLRLGTTFPRLLCGLTPEMTYAGQWFENRGWPVNTQGRGGQGSPVTDWILRFMDLPGITIPSVDLVFRRCNESDAQQVLDIDSRQPATSHHTLGWYDQYAQALKYGYIGDIVVGLENDTIVATAITYVPGQHSPAAVDMPWAGSLNSNIGGVTCICLRGKP
jgi:GNAT superfamily N-acetyltransferase